MTAKELSEKMVDEKNTLKLYAKYVEKALYTKGLMTNEEWKEYLEITSEIVSILHNLNDTSIDTVFAELCDQMAYSEKAYDNIKNILDKINLYIAQYEREMGICNVCGQEVYYLPLPVYYEQQRLKYGGKKTIPETLNRQKYVCPECGAVDRDRMIIGYMQKSGILQTAEKVLQIAPAKMIDVYIQQQLESDKYDTADLFMEGVTYQSDIQNMIEISDETYDLWICSHVLEHVADDRKALRELNRILKPDGCGILLVPLDLSREETDEEQGCSEAENWRRFGQGDHVRAYAKKDFIARVKECGFDLECVGKEYFGEEFFKNCGLIDTSTLYIVRKNKNKAKEYWDNYHEEERTRWWHSPEIIRHFNKNICGKPLDGWNAGGFELLKEYLHGRKIEKAISIGCGSAWKEIDLVKSGLVSSILCYDLSENMIRKAQENACRENVEKQMRFICGDVFKSMEPNPQFDLVFWDNSLHHMENARQAVQFSYQILKENGYLYCNDYVGASRFQRTDMEMAIVNGIRLYLPDEIFVKPGGGEYQRFYVGPTVEQIINMDPSEAADSENIIPAIKENFIHADIRYAGGLIYLVCMEDIIHNIAEDDPLLNYLLELDDQTIKFGLSQYAVILAQKRG